jgi:drug/metabolite transporter (DMT)-like permease
VLAIASGGAAAILGVYSAALGDRFAGFPTHSWVAMIGAAAVAQVGGVLGIVWALRWARASFASVALLAQPVGTSLLAWWLLGERIGARQALGGAAVLAAIALASGRALDVDRERPS